MSRLRPDYSVQKIEVIPGRLLQPGERSCSGIYALCSTKGDRILRVPMDFGTANLLCDWNNRILKEAYIKVK